MEGIEHNVLRDGHGRPMEYLRLSVTDRCNLRCFYCMPSEKMKFLPREELLSYEEMERIIEVLVGLGLKKVRITGGEPFVRKDLMGFLTNVRTDHPQLEFGITSNGVLLGSYLPELHELGIRNVNLSLDTLDPGRFLRITARDDFEKVYSCLLSMIEMGFNTKLNFVVMDGVNDDEIVVFAKLAKDFPVHVRFIEEMPFNGHGKQRGFISHERIKAALENQFGSLEFDQIGSSSSQDSRPKGFEGRVGIIPSFTRTFCGSCNRIRISATGKVKTCLYGKDDLDLRALIREGGNAELANGISNAFMRRPENGIEAEKGSELISMSQIGG